MKPVVARTIVGTGLLGLVLAIVGGGYNIGVMVWAGVTMVGVLGLLAVIGLITGRNTLPTDDEIIGK